MQKCIVCGSDKFEGMYDNTLLKCTSCGFVTANMSVSDEQLKEIYSENYFKGNAYSDYVADKLILQKNFSNRLDYINVNGKVNALEIGCAYGFFGEVFIKKFEKAEYTGIDIASEAINYGKENLKLNLQEYDYLNFPPAEKYTHVFMWDVIEHLPRPDLFVQKISGEMSKGGELHITTGDIDAMLPKIQKNKWRMIHPPIHLHYFTKKSLSKLVTVSGFEVKNIRYEAVYRSIKQIFYSLFLFNKPKNSALEKIYKNISEGWFVPLNSFDIMHLIAVKK